MTDATRAGPVRACWSDVCVFRGAAGAWAATGDGHAASRSLPEPRIAAWSRPARATPARRCCVPMTRASVASWNGRRPLVSYRVPPGASSRAHGANEQAAPASSHDVTAPRRPGCKPTRVEPDLGGCKEDAGRSHAARAGRRTIARGAELDCCAMRPRRVRTPCIGLVSCVWSHVGQRLARVRGLTQTSACWRMSSLRSPLTTLEQQIADRLREACHVC